MGHKYSKKILEVLNVISKRNLIENLHLDKSGEVIIGLDHLFQIPEIEIRFNGYFPAMVRLWPGDTPTAPNSPFVSSLDIGVDTVN